MKRRFLLVIALVILFALFTSRRRHSMSYHAPQPDYRWACKQGGNDQLAPWLKCSFNDHIGSNAQKLQNWNACAALRRESQNWHGQHLWDQGLDPTNNRAWMNHEKPIEWAQDEARNCSWIMDEQQRMMWAQQQAYMQMVKRQ